MESKNERVEKKLTLWNANYLYVRGHITHQIDMTYFMSVLKCLRQLQIILGPVWHVLVLKIMPN